MRFTSLCCALALLAPQGMAAQAPQQPSRPGSPRARPDTVPITLRPIVVTAPRIEVPLSANPAATQVVGVERLDLLPKGISVEEAVALVPGVKVDNQANGRRVHLSIRGQGILSERGIRGTKVLLDGLPLNDPSGFAADLYDVDWPTVDRVEVQRGPGASLYGGGSAAGVLNIHTADGGAALVSLLGSGVYGSHGFQRTTGQMGGTADEVNYRTSFTHVRGDGYRVHTAFHGDNVYAKVHMSPVAGLRLTPVLAYTEFYNENAEGLNLTWLAQDRRQANPDAVTFNEYLNTRRFVAGTSGAWDLSPASNLSFDAYLRRTAFREAVPSTVQHRTMTSPGATLQYTTARATGALRHHVSVGSDVQWQTIDEYRLPNLGGAVEGSVRVSDQTLRQSGVGVFALDRIELGGPWGAMLNVRYDRMGNKLADRYQAGGTDLSGSANFSRVTARAGVTFAPPSSGWSVYANAGQGFMPPATEELANNPDQLGGFNRSLRAATSWGEEVGVRGAVGDRAAFDVSAFHLETDGDFDRYRVATRPLETFYRNAGASRRFGVETYLMWVPTPETKLQVAYTWSAFRYLNRTSAYGNVRGHRLPNSPDHQLFADGEVALTGNLSLGVSAELLSRWYVDPGNVTSVDGYTLLHARAAYRVTLLGAGTEVTFAVRNLFGKQYIGFTEPDPDGNSYQPAAEREFFVGFKVTR
jgi:iron complex outermembrane recepter protein